LKGRTLLWPCCGSPLKLLDLGREFCVAFERAPGTDDRIAESPPTAMVIDIDGGARLKPLDTSAATLAGDSCVRERGEQASTIRAIQAEARSPGGAQSTLLIRLCEQEFLRLAVARRRHAGDHARRASPALVPDPCRRAASRNVGSVETFGEYAFESLLSDDRPAQRRP
jgi:hypothetical protein